jgi:hypothetical protein
MKKLLFSLSTVVLVTTASAAICAEPSNRSPHALACMAKVGITREGWVAHHAGTDAQVAQYIACRDGVSLGHAKQTGRENGNFGTR